MNNSKLDLTALVSRFETQLKTSPGLVTSAVTLITMGIRMMKDVGVNDQTKQKELLLQILTRVAMGKDGVSGTSDDIIPAKIMEQLNTLLNTQMASDIITSLHGVASGSITIPKTGCLDCLKKA